MLTSILKTLSKKELARPLGRWGVTHDQAIKLLARSNIYDHSFSNNENKETYCKFHVGETITYCKECFTMVNQNKLKYSNKKYNIGYLDDKMCVYPKKKK